MPEVERAVPRPFLVVYQRSASLKLARDRELQLEAANSSISLRLRESKVAAVVFSHRDVVAGEFVADAFAVEQVETGTDYDGAAQHSPAIGFLAKHGNAEQGGTDNLGIEERCEHRGRRVAMRRDQQELSAAACRT